MRWSSTSRSSAKATSRTCSTSSAWTFREGRTPLTAVLLAALGAALLWGSAELLVRGATTLGARAGIPSIVIGLTVVSVGTSAPEFVVSLTAALSGSADLAVGNVLGSNLANIGLILGITALVRPLRIASQVVRREIPWMLVVTLLVFPFALNGMLTRAEGGILVAVLAVYLYYLFAGGGAEQVVDLEGLEVEAASEDDVGYLKPVALVMFGGLGLAAGARAIVIGGSQLAELLSLPPMIIGLSVLAIGTSLPELATSTVAAARGQTDLAVGNIVGSNIFNLTFVLGGTALVRPIELDPGVLQIEFPAVAIMSAILLPLAWARPTMARWEGFMLLGMYAVMWAWIVVGGGL